MIYADQEYMFPLNIGDKTTSYLFVSLLAMIRLDPIATIYFARFLSIHGALS